MQLATAVRRRVTRSRRGVLAILAGTAAGQALGLLTAPLLSRLYSPEDFGVFTILSALIATVGTVAACRLELAVPLPERDRDAHSLVTLGLGATVVTALAGTLVVAVAGDTLAGVFNEPELMPWLWFVPVTAAMMGAYLVLNQLAVRDRRYGVVGRRNLFQSVTMVTTQVVAGAAGVGPGGLVAGLGLGHVAGAVTLVRGAGFRGLEARAGLYRRSVRRVLSRYRRFPLLLAPSGLLNVLGLHLPVILIAYWYGSEVVGWLGLTQRVLTLPVTLIGTAVAQVYLGELARAVRSDPFRAHLLFLRSTGGLVAVGVVSALALIMVGPWTFSVVFGTEWENSGQFARALAPALAAQIVAVPLSQTLVVLERQSLQVTWDVLRLLGTSAAVAFAAHQHASALTAVWLLGISSSLFYIASWMLSRNGLKRLLALS